MKNQLNEKKSSVVASNARKNRTKKTFYVDTIDNDHAIFESNFNASSSIKRNRAEKNRTKKNRRIKNRTKKIQKKKNSEAKQKSKNEKKTLHRVKFRKSNS